MSQREDLVVIGRHVRRLSGRGATRNSTTFRNYSPAAKRSGKLSQSHGGAAAVIIYIAPTCLPVALRQLFR